MPFILYFQNNQFSKYYLFLTLILKSISLFSLLLLSLRVCDFGLGLGFIIFLVSYITDLHLLVIRLQLSSSKVFIFIIFYI